MFLMLGEDGMIKDDGIVCKINDQHFITTQQLQEGLQMFWHTWKSMLKQSGPI